eukprot:Hpha_TRINITY_DN8770_c0_g1::TRINITY_DN8770_c0_g1_i1::g.45254::m.45254
MPPAVPVTLSNVVQSRGSHRGVFFDLSTETKNVTITHLEVAMGWRSGHVQVYTYERDEKEGPDKFAGYMDGKDGPYAWKVVSKKVWIQSCRPPYGSKKSLVTIPLEWPEGSKPGGKGVNLPTDRPRGFCVHSSDGYVAFSDPGCAEEVKSDGVLTLHRGDWTSMEKIHDLFSWLYTAEPIRSDRRAFIGRIRYTVPEDKAPEPDTDNKWKVGDQVRLSQVDWMRRADTALRDKEVGRLVAYEEGHLAACKVEFGDQTSWFETTHLERIA